MTKSRLFVVELTREVVVLAEDTDAAYQIAIESVFKDDGPPEVKVSEMTYYPADWDESCAPFGYRDEADPDRSIDEWIELGAGPHMAKRRAKR